MKSSKFFPGVFAVFISIAIENAVSEASFGGDFALTFEGFLPLVDSDYHLRAMEDNDFSEKISLSMYRYYMTQHLYLRLAQILQYRDPSDNRYNRLVSTVQSAAPIVPQPIFKYLNAIGDISMKVTKQLKYAFIMWPNDDGDFGRVDGTNHWKYMSFPAPSIIAQAIQEDYFHTINESARNIPFWNLKSNLVPHDILNEDKPECRSPGYPTQNLLGWKPFIRLTFPQIQILESCLITDYIFENIDSQFYLNPCLLEYIYATLRKQSKISNFTRITLYPRFITTNVLLRSWIEPLDLDGCFSRTAVHIDQNIVLHTDNPRDPNYLDVLVMAVQVLKTEIYKKWSIFEWSQYRCVPNDWVATRNTVFEYFQPRGKHSTNTLRFKRYSELRRRRFLGSE